MRIEKDSLGTIELADDIYYGIQTARAVENFPISGTKLHPIMVTAYLWIKIAAAKTNGELGTIDGKIARAIVQAGEEALSGKFDKYFVVDAFQAGAGTSFNMNANEVLANRACELLGGQKGDSKLVSPNDHVNRGQSTNDTFPAAMRVAILKLSEKLLPSLQLLTDELKRKGEEFGSVAKSGRTHMQDAVPITLGREFNAYSGYLEKARERLDQALSNLQYSNLGGTAVGTGVNAHPEYSKLVVKKLSALSGLTLKTPKDLVEIMQNMGDFVGVSAALRSLAIDLVKIANDLRLLSSGPGTGFNEIVLPAVQPGSSIMPGKVNPVMAEMLNMVAFQVMGNDTAVVLGAQAGQLELNVMMPLLARNILESMEILANSMRVFAVKCIAGITANRERCRELGLKSLSLATPLATRIGYLQAAEVVKSALKENKTIPEKVREMSLLTDVEIQEILNLEKMANMH